MSSPTPAQLRALLRSKARPVVVPLGFLLAGAAVLLLVCVIAGFIARAVL